MVQTENKGQNIVMVIICVVIVQIITKVAKVVKLVRHLTERNIGIYYVFQKHSQFGVNEPVQVSKEDSNAVSSNYQFNKI